MADRGPEQFRSSRPIRDRSPFGGGWAGDDLDVPGTLTAGSITGTITDADAIHDNEASEISAIAEKTQLHADDLFIIEDSEAGNAKKRVKAKAVPMMIVRAISNELTVPDGVTYLTHHPIITASVILEGSAVFLVL